MLIILDYRGDILDVVSGRLKPESLS
jgi:hypothetical protein